MDKKEIALLLGITAIAVVCWIVFDALHTHAKVAVSPDLQKALEPINTTFDQSTLDRVSKVSNTFTPPPAPSLTPAPTPSPSASSSAQVKPSPSPINSSTPSASLQP